MGSVNEEKLLACFGRNILRSHPIDERVSRKIGVEDELVGFFGPDYPPGQINRWVLDIGKRQLRKAREIFRPEYPPVSSDQWVLDKRDSH